MQHFIAVLVFLVSGISVVQAECSAMIDMKIDTQNSAQAKLDCLVKENASLKDTIAKAPDYPHMASNIFLARDYQEVLQIKINTIAWITSHHGTTTTGDVKASAVGGHVGHYNIGAYCIDANGVCLVVAAGPDYQEISDAVHAIH